MLLRNWIQRNFMPFTPGQIQFFSLVFYFLMSPSFNALQLPAATDNSFLYNVPEWDLSLSLRINSTPTSSCWLTLSLLPLLLLSLHFPGQSLFYLVNKSSAYSPLIITFQNSLRIQDSNCMIHRSRIS